MQMLQFAWILCALIIALYIPYWYLAIGQPWASSLRSKKKQRCHRFLSRNFVEPCISGLSSLTEFV